MNCEFNISLHFETLAAFVEKNLMQSRVVSCHVLIIPSLASRLYGGRFQTFQSEQILSLRFVSRLEVISGAFCF